MSGEQSALAEHAIDETSQLGVSHGEVIDATELFTHAAHPPVEVPESSKPFLSSAQYDLVKSAHDEIIWDIFTNYNPEKYPHQLATAIKFVEQFPAFTEENFAGCHDDKFMPEQIVGDKRFAAYIEKFTADHAGAYVTPKFYAKLIMRCLNIPEGRARSPQDLAEKANEILTALTHTLRVESKIPLERLKIFQSASMVGTLDLAKMDAVAKGEPLFRRLVAKHIEEILKVDPAQESSKRIKNLKSELTRPMMLKDAQIFSENGAEDGAKILAMCADPDMRKQPAYKFVTSTTFRRNPERFFDNPDTRFVSKPTIIPEGQDRDQKAYSLAAIHKSAALKVASKVLHGANREALPVMADLNYFLPPRIVISEGPFDPESTFDPACE